MPKTTKDKGNKENQMRQKMYFYDKKKHNDMKKTKVSKVHRGTSRTEIAL